MFFYEGLKPDMTCALKIDTTRKGWYETMSKILGKRQGLSYDWDAKEGMLYISGKIDAQKILKIVKANKKTVEIQYMRAENCAGVDQNYALSAYCAPSYHGGYYHSPPPPPLMSHYNYYNSYLPQSPYHY